MHLGAFEATLIMLGSSPPSLSLLLGVIRGFGLSFVHFQYEALVLVRDRLLTSPWPFYVWGIDIIGKISPRSSSGHEFILVTIDYFTKWVEATSYARLTYAKVASFIRSHIICRHGVPHELISDRGSHFRAEVDTLLQRYGVQHHKSSTYRPQTNGAVEATNKNIKRILRKMVETSRD